MTADINKLLNEAASFIETVENKRSHIEDIMTQLEKNVRIIRNQMENYTVSKSAAVSANMLEKFPDIKQRLLSRINRVIEEEVDKMTKNVDQLSEFSEELQTRSNKIESLMVRIKWKEHIHCFITFSGIFEWTDKCWKYFHLICMNLRNGLTTIIIDDAHSCTQFKYMDTLDGVNREYVFSNRVVERLQLLKVDCSSRSKISV